MSQLRVGNVTEGLSTTTPTHSLAVVTALLVSLLVSTGIAWCSVTGRISGTVVDPTGAVVLGATATALNTDTGIKQTTATNGEGFYIFPSLPAGHYDLEVQQRGFKEYKKIGLLVDVNTGLTANVRLELGQASQQVTVQDAEVHVETINTQMGDVISGTEMTTVPLDGRSYTDLLALQPGVAPVSSNVMMGSGRSVSGNLNPGNMSVNGQRESSNGFMVNGGDVQEPIAMGTAIIPNLDSIAEFRIITNNSDAEYGNYNGGLINAITKSGTNRFHGDLFEFLRNTVLDARNFYNLDRGSFIQNQFGGSVGGPIKTDKVFFFGDYQGTRQVMGVPTNVLVPSVANRTGNLADSASSLTGTVIGSYWANQLSQEIGYNVKPGEHYYTPGCISNTACVFPNAVIPQSAFAAPSKALMKYIPEPNVGSFFSTAALNERLRDDKTGTRVDANTQWGMISAYYFFDDSNLVTPSSFPGFTSGNVLRAQMATASDTKSFGDHAINELRFNYVRTAGVAGTPESGVGVSLSSLGFQVGPNTLGIVPQFTQLEGPPPIQLNNFSFGSSQVFVSTKENTYQLLDAFTKIIGVHTLKFGGSYHENQVLDHAIYNEPSFVFNGSETGSDWADFLIGAPQIYSQSDQPVFYPRSRYGALFIEDSWRAKSNLTLNYGLRWEVSTPWWEKYNQIENIVPGQQSKVFPGAPTSWVFPGDVGVPRTLSPTRYNNFAPRFGLAYSPSAQGGFLGKLLGSGRTSLRASYGLYYTAYEAAGTYNEFGDAPYGFYYTSPVPPLFATPFVDRATGNSQGQRFPATLPPHNVSPSNPDTTFNWSKVEPISSSPGWLPTNRLPYADHYSVSIQRQLGNTSLLEVAYVGTQGHRLLTSLEANAGNPALCLSVSEPSQVAPGSPVCVPAGENGVYTTAAGQVINGTRGPLGPLFGSMDWISDIASSNYNSLQITMRHNGGRLQLLGAYTFSKSMDDSSAYSDQINFLNFKASYALSAFNVTNNFVLSYSFELPIDKLPGPKRLTNGWKLAGITRFATGLPVFLYENDDNSLLGTYAGGSDSNALDVPNCTPGNLNFTDPRSSKPYFNTSLFSPEARGQLGDCKRRFFHGPGINNFDMALLKDTSIRERVTLQFRAEFFNAFNHAQFGPPQGLINSGPGFGLVTSTGQAARIVQASLKLLF